MLRVTVEMIPFGVEQRARTIGVMEISNVKDLKNNAADYVVGVYNHEDKMVYDFRINGFDRDRRAWALVYEALKRMNL